LRIRKTLHPQEKKWLLETVGDQDVYYHSDGVSADRLATWNYRFERDHHYVYIANDRLATAFLLKFGQ
jgi:hypothetical protein